MSQFTKAYSFEQYLAASKANFAALGVNAAEEVLEALIKKQYYTTKEWLVESSKLTQTPFDDIAMTQINQFDAAVEGVNIDLNKDGV